ncbi:MAG: DNA polymerase IV [Nitrosopumilus sp. B06]|nr:MAG: DNA polymerase IV [Nitrosopumilus sp. D6]RNJ80715.1 MAG: DNA polymerase IV [Nitrosopumilus sp. B06]
MGSRVVMHVDFDYFYVQCEEIRRPELRPKPVCVCVYSERGGDSGAVATANYAARKYGAKSGMSITLAKRKLEGRDDAVFLPVDFAHYEKISESAMGVISSFADVFEYVGKDEAYLDVTDRTGDDFERAGHLAQQIKNAVRDKAKIGCSIGVSPNKLVSKIASDYQKPDGLTIVRRERVEEFLDPLKIRDIPGIGGKTEKHLAVMNLKTIQDLRGIDIFDLNREFGRKNGTYIYNAARGIDENPVSRRDAQIQYSRISTLKKDSKEYAFLAEYLESMCRDVHHTVSENSQMFKSVGIHLVQSDMSVRSKSKVLRAPTMSLGELKKCADGLLRETLKSQKIDIRRLGVRISELTEVSGQDDITSYF